MVGKQSKPRRAADLSLALIEAVEEIEAGCSDFDGGRVSAHQSVATQLRKLLTEANPLLQRVLPNIKFERLRPPKGSNASWVVDPRGTLSISTGTPPVRIELETLAGDEISPEQWMDDWIITPDCSIRELIKEIGNKESAHTDDKLGPKVSGLEANQTVTSSSSGQVEMRKAAVVAVGAYVAGRIRIHLNR